MPKALITGCAGFIGPHMVEACLNRNWEVFGVDKRPCDLKHRNFIFKQWDVRHLEREDLAGCDFIFHLAFVTNIPNSINNPVETTKDNIDMSVALLDIAAKAKVKKFLFASTASLYGDNPTPWREDMPVTPMEPYSWQKLAVEQACQMWTKRYGLATTIFRFFQVFGENQRPDTALAAFFRAKKDGKPITLTETTAQSAFRSGQRDFVYVKDLAEACVLAAESEKTGRGEIINIGSGRAICMEDVAQAIGGEVNWIPRRGFEVERHEADILLARALLGWEPKVEILSWLKERRWA